MNKKLIMIAMFGILLVSFMSFIPAQDTISEKNPTSLEKFFYKLKYKYGIFEKFSAVGDDQGCGCNNECDGECESWNAGEGHEACVTWTAETGGDSINEDASDYCPSGHGLFDVFVDGWLPWKEFKDDVSFTCKYTNDCHVELYCCGNEECDSDQDCVDWGEGNDCDTEYCDSFGSSYKCDPNDDIVYEYSSYSYCDTDAITCWYVDGDTCYSNDYTNWAECEGHEYQNNPLYDSKSECLSHACESHDSKKCYNNDVYWYDSCGDREGEYEDCGSSGCENGQCISCITESELSNYIDEWVNGQISRTTLGNKIVEWIEC